MEKTQVRHGAFETNSSSTHSITISDKDPVLNPNKNGKNIVDIYTGEYGWEEEWYSGFSANASYIATYILSGVDPHLTEDEEWLSQEAIDNIPELKMMTEIIKLYTGCEEVRYHPTNTNYNRWGYIDSQSFEVPGQALGSRNTLARFLFGPGSGFTTGNDNG
jgi:hypothetical protein